MRIAIDIHGPILDAGASDFLDNEQLVEKDILSYLRSILLKNHEIYLIANARKTKQNEMREIEVLKPIFALETEYKNCHVCFLKQKSFAKRDFCLDKKIDLIIDDNLELLKHLVTTPDIETKGILFSPMGSITKFESFPHINIASNWNQIVSYLQIHNV